MIKTIGRFGPRGAGMAASRLAKSLRAPRLGVRRRTLSLALQGGGAHGAFTWGVLDRLLEDQRLVIDGISGASAGALNGAALASGWHTGGREGARQAWEMGMALPTPNRRASYEAVETTPRPCPPFGSAPKTNGSIPPV